MSLTNVYHLRRVADTSAKPCLICFKPATSVMITPDNKVTVPRVCFYQMKHVFLNPCPIRGPQYPLTQTDLVQDFFYVCPAHLQDRNFCSPVIDAEGEAKRKKEEAMAKEIEKVKQEYEEKQRRKKEKAREEKDKKDKDKDDSKEKDKGSDSKPDDEKKERDDKVSPLVFNPTSPVNIPLLD